MSYAIEFNHLTKRFGNHTVLDDLNFNIHEGKITTILGFSGAGKSTVLKHILGIYHPTEGQVKVLGQDMEKMNEGQIREFRTNFGMVFQYAALFDSMTNFENVAFPMKEFTNYTKEEIEEKAIGLMKQVGLDEFAFHKLPSEISGGMRKRVGLARALALQPKVMLYDEPTTGLDPITTHMVDDLITSTHNHNAHLPMTSVIISHDIAATLRISDYVAFLEKGKTVVHAPVEEFRKSDHPVIKKFIELST
ncbi:MAG: ABC transporter ATP-binding protein [Halobacteriovoraceae bacterium]|nr:ABC transporter ATP-binding protein [Halobacteriovoraceae bacterium]|tara:strand:+ start:334088 stop:334834 length:747 start_codon:yes stop_codon:yes gene_type:complete